MSKHIQVFIAILILIFSTSLQTSLQADTGHKATGFFDLSSTSALGLKVKFSDYRGYVVLVVNIATRCGTTPQLGQLQELYEKYKDRQFVVFGFPSEDISAAQFQEDHLIHNFCSEKFGITFPVFQTISIKGADLDPVFKFLTEHCPADMQSEIGFNFEKFLVGKDGQLKKRYGPFTGPLSARIKADIELELAK